MSDYAPRPNRGKVQIVYDVLNAQGGGLTQHSIAYLVDPDGDAKHLANVRRTLSNGDSAGYFTHYKLMDQRFYRRSTRLEYEQQRTDNAHRKASLKAQRYLDEKAPTLSSFRAWMVDFTNKLKSVK